jgi:hypothetical protein
MLVIVVVLILILYICKSMKDTEHLRNNDSSIQGGSSQDGITSGFANNDKDQIKMIRHKFDTWIKPTLSHFLSQYDKRTDLQQLYRLKR